MRVAARVPCTDLSVAVLERERAKRAGECPGALTDSLTDDWLGNAARHKVGHVCPSKISELHVNACGGAVLCPSMLY